MTKRPIILGATGKIGRMLRACHQDVWPVEPVWQARHPMPGHVTWDILTETPPKLDCSGVVMLAGRQDDCAETHVALANAACKLAHRYGVRALIASTQAVYGAPDAPVHEGCDPDPKSDYAKAKLAMESAVSGCDNVCCLRIGNVIGADHLMRSAATPPVKLEQFVDGSGPKRMMIGPVTLARALRDLLDLIDVPPVLNLAQPGLVAMEDVLTATGVDWAWVPARAHALRQLEMNVARAGNLVTLPKADAETLVSEARAVGWPFT